MKSKKSLRVSLLILAAATLASLANATVLKYAALPAGAQEGSTEPEPPGPPAIISNGTVQLGVNSEGNLGVPGGDPSPSGGTDVVGLRFSANGNEGISPGETQESWGVADAASGTFGSANESDFYFIGKTNVTATEFTSTEDTARSVAFIGANGNAPSPSFEVTHEFRPSPFSENLYEAFVTVENVSGNPAEDVRYRRVVDWDAEPTPFSEVVTVGGSQIGELLFASNDGFADPNPLGERTDSGATGFFADSGPSDQGSTFDFDLGSIGPGATETFKLFYGAAATEAEARNALSGAGADVYSLARPDVRDATEIGAPNTFMLGFLLTQRPPTTVDDAAETDAGAAVEVDVLANDTDLNSDPLTVTDFSQGENGEVDCSPEGICTYKPNDGFDGEDTFTYTVSDGNGGTATGAVRITVAEPIDTTPPDTIIDSGPEGYVNGTSASFEFSSTKPNSTFMCKLDTAVFEPCSSLKTYNSLSEGSHEFRVRARAANGIADPTVALRSWQVDVTRPQATRPQKGFIVSSTLRQDVGNSDVPVRISWSGSDADSGVARYELQRNDDGGEWSSDLLNQQPVNPEQETAKSNTIERLSSNSTRYTFRVRTQDAAGNWSNWVEMRSSYGTATSFSIGRFQELHPSIEYPLGAWTRQQMDDAYGGYSKYSLPTGRAELSLDKGTIISELAWVSSKGANRGTATTWLNDERTDVVDLYSPTFEPRLIVSKSASSNSCVADKLEVRNPGTKNPSSANTRVDVDAILVMEEHPEGVSCGQ